MPPKGKQGNLEKQLDEYIALRNLSTNQEKIQKARGVLVRAVHQRIEDGGDNLSPEEVKTLKEARNENFQSGNETLAWRVLRALDKGKWDVLRIELVTFSRVKSEHMEKMGIEILPLHPYQLILGRVDRLDRLYQLNIAPPTQTLLGDFINLYYPTRSRMYLSEMVAKHKMIGYFDLLDSFFPSGENCWVLLNELPLAKLSSTSQPSEVKATVKSSTSTPIGRSTFLTGHADMAIVSLAGKNEPIIQDRYMRDKLLKCTRGPLTYDGLFDRMNLLKKASGSENFSGVESLQFLVMEAKMNEYISGNVSEVDTTDDEEGEFEDGSERSPEDSDDDSDEGAGTEKEDGDKGQAEEEVEGQGRGGGEKCDGGDLDGDEGSEDTNKVDQGSDSSEGENEEIPLSRHRF